MVMPTIRHRKALRNIGNSRTEAEALVKANYSPSYARSGQIKKTKGWQVLLDKSLPDSKLMKRHQELLDKRDTQVIVVGEEKVKIDLGPETNAVKSGLDMAYKLKNRYPNEKGDNGNKTLILIVSGESASRYGVHPNTDTENNSTG